MKCFTVFFAVCLSAIAINGQQQPQTASRVLCYFDGTATQREGMKLFSK